MSSRHVFRRAVDDRSDSRDMWPDDDGGTGQVLGCLGGIGAIVGTVIGCLIAFVTDNAALKAIDNGLVLLAVPLAAWGVGLLITVAWDAAVKRATRLGSPAEHLRDPGQVVTAVLAGLAPATVAVILLLLVPWLAIPLIALGIAALLGEQVYVRIKRIWDVAT